MIDKIIRSLGIILLLIIYLLMIVGLMITINGYEENIKEINVENHELKKENIQLRTQIGLKQ